MEASACNTPLVRFGNIINRLNERVKKSKQNYHPLPFSDTVCTNGSLTTFEDVQIRNINPVQFQKMISLNKSTFKYLAIYTSGCQGSEGESEYIKSSAQIYKDLVKFYLVSSDNIAPYLVQMLQNKLFSRHFFCSSYIIVETIKSSTDHRKRGETFRNQICPEYQNDVIGVPYVILFNKENQVLFHGYRGYKTKLPPDIIKYFVAKNSE